MMYIYSEQLAKKYNLDATYKGWATKVKVDLTKPVKFVELSGLKYMYLDFGTEKLSRIEVDAKVFRPFIVDKNLEDYL